MLGFNFPERILKVGQIGKVFQLDLTLVGPDLKFMRCVNRRFGRLQKTLRGLPVIIPLFEVVDLLLAIMNYGWLQALFGSLPLNQSSSTLRFTVLEFGIVPWVHGTDSIIYCSEFLF